MAVKKKQEKVKTPFIVALGFNAGCCSSIHVMMRLVMAETEERAKASVLKSAARQGFEFNRETSVIAAPLAEFSSEQLIGVRQGHKHA